MTQKFDLGPWEIYAGEAAHYSHVRCLDLGRIYEAVRVTHEKDVGQAEFLHQVFFMAEYSEPELVEILWGFGFESLDAYVSEMNQRGFVIGPDGKIDRRKSPAWYIDYMYLASLMAEHFEGRRIPVQEADRLELLVEVVHHLGIVSCSPALSSSNWCRIYSSIFFAFFPAVST